VATNITGQLWVGGYEDAPRFDGETLCVVRPGHPHWRMHEMPIAGAGGLPGQRTHAEHLDKVAEFITSRLAVGKALLVYDEQGRDWAPLACGWYLWKTGRWASLAACYDVLKAMRPNVIDCSAWVANA
jgi:hypothetical protein